MHNRAAGTTPQTSHGPHDPHSDDGKVRKVCTYVSVRVCSWVWVWGGAHRGRGGQRGSKDRTLFCGLYLCECACLYVGVGVNCGGCTEAGEGKGMEKPSVKVAFCQAVAMSAFLVLCCMY